MNSSARRMSAAVNSAKLLPPSRTAALRIEPQAVQDGHWPLAMKVASRAR